MVMMRAWVLGCIVNAELHSQIPNPDLVSVDARFYDASYNLTFSVIYSLKRSCLLKRSGFDCTEWNAL